MAWLYYIAFYAPTRLSPCCVERKNQDSHKRSVMKPKVPCTRTSIWVRQIVGMNAHIIGIGIVDEAYCLDIGATF